MKRYILDSNRKPVKCYDLTEWSIWFSDISNRRLKCETLHLGNLCVTVSTVFLAIDHNCSLEGPPVLWETLVFDGTIHNAAAKEERYTSLGERYISEASAIAGHDRIRECVIAEITGEHKSFKEAKETAERINRDE